MFVISNPPHHLIFLSLFKPFLIKQYIKHMYFRVHTIPSDPPRVPPRLPLCFCLPVIVLSSGRFKAFSSLCCVKILFYLVSFRLAFIVCACLVGQKPREPHLFYLRPCPIRLCISVLERRDSIVMYHSYNSLKLSLYRSAIHSTGCRYGDIPGSVLSTSVIH